MKIIKFKEEGFFMRKLRMFVLVLSIFLMLLSIMVFANTTNENTYIWRIGTGSGGSNLNPYIWTMEQIKKTVEERSNGRIEVQLYPSGQLGSLMELSHGLLDGTVDTALIPVQWYTSFIPEMFVFDLSYQFKSDMEAIEILNNNDTIIEKRMINKGIIPAAWIRLFDRITISNRKIENIEDWKGLKIWFAPSTLIMNKASLLGAVGANFDLGELASSLQTGTIDGVWTDVSLMAGQSLYDNAPYILNSPKDLLISVLAISKIWFDKLPNDLQTLVIECAKEVAESEYKRVDEVYEVFKNNLLEGGAEFYEPNEALTNAMKEALKDEASWLLENHPDIKDAYLELQELITAHRKQ